MGNSKTKEDPAGHWSCFWSIHSCFWIEHFTTLEIFRSGLERIQAVLAEAKSFVEQVTTLSHGYYLVTIVTSSFLPLVVMPLVLVAPHLIPKPTHGRPWSVPSTFTIPFDARPTPGRHNSETTGTARRSIRWGAARRGSHWSCLETLQTLEEANLGLSTALHMGGLLNQQHLYMTDLLTPAKTGRSQSC